MKVDISDMIRVNGASKELDFAEEPFDKEPLKDCFIEGDVTFAGTLTNLNGVLQLDGQLKAGYRSECYRCLCPVTKVLDIKIKESFVSNGDDSEQTDMYFFKGKILDISKAINDNIILNFPMTQLCSDDCKGLCVSCGANLNEAECNCIKGDSDMRLEVLNKYFDNL